MDQRIPARLAVLAVAFLSAALAHGQAAITAAEAKDHIGERATVCGVVASTHYAARTRGSPTFLNLGEPYPEQIFTVVIWGNDRPKFGSPEVTYREKNICVSGTISMYKGSPEVVASDPNQIKRR